MIDQDTIVRSISAATHEVFSTMLALDIRAGESYIERGGSNPSEGVVALIGLAGDWVGTGIVSCSAGFACTLASHLLMLDAKPENRAVDEEVLDAVAEVANMIIGNVKTALEERLGPMGMSIPTVIFGKNFTARSAGDQQWIIVPFFCEGERMDVKLCVARSAEPHPVRHGFNPQHLVQGR